MSRSDDFLGPEPTDKQRRDYYDALVAGDLDKVKSCLEENPHFLAEDHNHNNQPRHSLVIAAMKGCEKIVLYLIEEKGVDIHVQIDCVLCLSAGNGHLEVVQLLLEKGADIHARVDYALWQSALNGHLEVVRLLLEKGADIHVWNDCALCCSASNGHLEVVQLLLEKGADIHVQNDAALYWSAEKGHLQVMQLLLEKGANVHASEDHALRWTISNNYQNMMKILLGYYSTKEISVLNQRYHEIQTSCQSSIQKETNIAKTMLETLNNSTSLPTVVLRTIVYPECRFSMITKQ